ncbi:unnamed protein product [Nippostrongylus brasiliensis]|uniref:Uncharacterized protein n=1 Tax=Nippostrongylus brasiliensis TaxID=27835 RepID=A0A0N4XG03_NIPBR|nr:unnamed protein product [Nippostrongylus brasiliensis]
MMNKIYLKVRLFKRIGIVEETKLEPTFEEGIKKVETYRLAVDGTLDGLEAMVQVKPYSLFQRRFSALFNLTDTNRYRPQSQFSKSLSRIQEHTNDTDKQGTNPCSNVLHFKLENNHFN